MRCKPERRVLYFMILLSTVSWGQPLDADSLRAQLRTEVPDSLKVKILIVLSEVATVGHDSSELYLRQALALATRTNNDFGIGDANRALIAFAKNEQEVDSLVSLATRYFKRANRQQYIPLIFLKAATRYITFGNKYVTAFHYANLFLTQYKNENDAENFAKGWNLVGEVHRVSENYEKALDAYRRSREYSLKGKIMFLAPIINVGTIQVELGQLDSAMRQYNWVEDYLVRTKLEGANTFGYIKYRKARVYLLQGKYDEALREAQLSLAVYTRLVHAEGKILALSVLSDVYYHRGAYKQAILYGEQGIALAKEINYVINDIGKICEIVANSYYQLKDFRNAYRYMEAQHDMQSKLHDPGLAAELTNELLELEQEKQQLQQELAEEQKKKDAVAIHGQQIIIFYTVGIVLILSGVSFLLYRNWKIKHKLNVELHERQNEILTQAEELKASKEEIEAINANLESIVHERTHIIRDQHARLSEYAYFNAHKIRGPLARILGLILVIDHEFPGEAKAPYREMLKTASNELDQAIKEINDVLEVKNEIGKNDKSRPD
jgi:tetratricopeptide (TPR) repeat protein